MKSADLNNFAVSAQVWPGSFAARVHQVASHRGFLDTRHELGGASVAQDGVLALGRPAFPYGWQRNLTCADQGDPPFARSAPAGKAGLLQTAEAVLAFERGQADVAQWQLLLSCTTTLSGSQAKCRWIDENGTSSIAKFSSGSEGLSLNRAEVLTMRMARMAGIDALDVRLLDPIRTPILVTPRFDHLPSGKDVAVLPAYTLLRSGENNSVDLKTLLELMKVHVHSDHLADDVRQLWQRMVFLCLTHHEGDFLRKIDFVSDGEGRWRLAPACGLRVQAGPLKDVVGNSESWQELRPTASELLTTADAYGIGMAQAWEYLRRQVTALSQWKSLAAQAFVNMSARDLARLEVPMFNAQIMGTRVQQSAYRRIDSFAR